MLSKYLTQKVEHMTSSLFTFILLWATKLHIRLCKNNNNNNNAKQQRNHQCSYGLRTLIQSEKLKLRCKILHCYNVATAAESSEPPLNYSPAKAALESSWWTWPSSPPEFRMGDVIGTESGYCMMSDVAEQMEAESEGQGFSGAWREKRERERRRKREIPPPITLLSKTTRMPWNFIRECGDDGRLIVRAVKRREYMEGNREISGRVIMRLVQEEEDDDGGDFCEECGWLMDEEAEAEEEEGVEFDGEMEGFDDDEEESAAIAEEEEEARLESESESESVRCGDLRRGVSYSAGGWVGVGDGASGCLGRPASVPIMPMTPVM